MDKKHEMLSKFKELRAELGRQPKKYELLRVTSKYTFEKHFSSWEEFLAACGETPEKPKKIDNSIFTKDIEQHIENYEPVPIKLHKPYPTIAICSDRHAPFTHKVGEKRFIEFVGDMKPKYVVDNGDGEDFLSHSKFPRSHNDFTPREERQLSLKMTREFWEKIIKASPKSTCYMTWGNHQARPLKRVLESYPESEDWIVEGLKRDYTFQGVTVLLDARQELIIDNICILHGYKTQAGSHRDYNLMNCVTGHSHVGSVTYRQIKGETLWELNTGYLGDQFAKGLDYTSQSMSKWTLGWGYIDRLGPRFVSL